MRKTYKIFIHIPFHRRCNQFYGVFIFSIRNIFTVTDMIEHLGRFGERKISKYCAGLNNNTKENDIATNFNQNLFTFWDEYRYIVPVTAIFIFTLLWWN